MRSSIDSTPPVAQGRWRAGVKRYWIDALAVVGAVALLAVFAGMLVRYRIAYVPEVDCQGYFLMGKAFSHFQWPCWENDLARFFGHVWVNVGQDQVMAKYPPGWPLLLAVGYWCGDLGGALWVNPILALLGAAAFFALAWLLFDSTVALICTAIWLFSPMVAFYVDYPLTHGPDVTFILLAFLFTVVWARHGGAGFAGLAGFCCGFIPLIRPTNVLLWPAIGALALTAAYERHVAQRRRDQDLAFWPAVRAAWREARETGGGGVGRPRRLGSVGRGLLVFTGAMAVPLAFFALYNWVSFGAPWRTGYFFTGEQTGFAFGDLRPRFVSLFNGRASLLEDKYWLLGLLGLLFRRGRQGLLWTFVLWCALPLLLYAGYYFFMASSVFYRFVLACLPAWILSLGFLWPTRRRLPALVRLAVLGAFATWFWVSPPRLFEVLGEIRRGRQYTNEEQTRDPSVGLTTHMVHKGRYNPSRELLSLVGAQPAAVYAGGSVGWTLGARRGGVSYDLNAWHDTHFFEPFTDRCGRDIVWEDRARHRQMHAWFATLGPDGLRLDFRQHVKADLDRGRAVFVAAGRGDAALDWLREDKQFALEDTGARGAWRVRPAP